MAIFDPKKTGMPVWSPALQIVLLVMLAMSVVLCSHPSSVYTLGVGTFALLTIHLGKMVGCGLSSTLRKKRLLYRFLLSQRWGGQLGYGILQLGDSVIGYSGMPVDAHHHRCRGIAVVMNERAVSASKLAGSVFDPVSERIDHVNWTKIPHWLCLFGSWLYTLQPLNLGMRGDGTVLLVVAGVFEAGFRAGHVTAYGWLQC